MSSNRAMCKIRSMLGVKTGYVGTLDPFAQGMLPIAVGDARKFISFVNDDVKQYSFSIKFGEETDTLDRCGRVVQSGDNIPSDAALCGAIKSFIGEIEQVPPVFSAININGQRAYRLALKGAEDVEMPTRRVHIYSLEYFGGNRFRCVCSKGTYIRSLIRDICHSLDTLGYAEYLRREKISFLDCNNAKTMEMIEESVYTASVEDLLLPIESALNDISAVILSDEHIRRLQNGLFRITNSNFVNGRMYQVYRESDNRFCGLVEAYEECKLRPVRMINV